MRRTDLWMIVTVKSGRSTLRPVGEVTDGLVRA